MGTKLNRFTGALWDLDTFYIHDDFNHYVTGDQFTTVASDSGTVAVTDATRGIVTLTPSDGTVTDNDETYIRSTTELFQFLAGREIYGRCRLNFVETASGVYNCFFGFANAIAANTLVDDGAGMRASGSIMAVHKNDGETVWRFTTRDSAGATTTVSTTSAVMATGTFQEIEIEARVRDALSYTASFKVDGRPALDSNGLVIRHTVLFASSTEMHIGVGAKLGAITNNDLTLVDFIYGSQRRVA